VERFSLVREPSYDEVASEISESISEGGILAFINTMFAGVEDLSARALLRVFNWIFSIRAFLELQGMDEKSSIFSSCSHHRFVKAEEAEGIRFQPYVSANYWFHFSAA
jgi:hypothetical protein